MGDVEQPGDEIAFGKREGLKTPLLSRFSFKVKGYFSINTGKSYRLVVDNPPVRCKISVLRKVMVFERGI